MNSSLKLSKSKIVLKRPSSKLEPIKPLKIKKHVVEEKKEQLYGLDFEFLRKLDLGDDARLILNDKNKDQEIDERPQTAISSLDGKLGKTTKLREVCTEFRK